MKNKGQLADAVAAYAHTDLAKEWCTSYGLNKMASYSIQKYTSEVATTMALQWCRKRQHYLNIWCAQNESKYTYTKADHDAYLPEQPWQTFMESLEQGTDAYKRALDIQLMAPTKPKSA
eukprot:1796872-Amphidinium_carterae.1